MTKHVRNIAASIRQRILNKAKAEKRPFNELLQYYAMERFLYRLSKSAHAQRFILKGALMLRVWQAPEARPTMDIDMLGLTDNSPEAISKQVKEILVTDVENDGLEFDDTSLNTEIIKEDADYQGVRVRLTGRLDNAQITLQLDIGFGDILVLGPTYANFPTLLDQPAPKLLCYSRESAIAEKFEAMIKLGDLNSRMKDFYDIWLLARQFDFDGETLLEAITQTFQHRDTELPTSLPFAEPFAEQKQKQWQAFHTRLGIEHIPESFDDICAELTKFLNVFSQLSNVPNLYWKAPGPWAIKQGVQ